MSKMQYPKLVESKTSANEVTTIEWNPGMDLLATVFNNGALTCSRLLSLQKVWHKQSFGKIISIAWRPDGRVLVIGAYNEKTKENLCTLHDVENGKEINSIKVEQSITSVAWFQYNPANEDKDQDDPILLKKVILPNSSDIKENFSHQLAHEQSQLSILMISTERDVIFYALGLFYLGEIVIIQGNPNSNSKITQAHMSSCLRYITTVISTKQASNSLTSMIISKLDTFQERNNEILKVSKMYAKITDELEYLDDTINAITTSWADVLAGLDNKLSSYCSRKNKNSNDSGGGGYTFLSADELLQLLVIGFPSDNLEKFLADMSDKGLKKLNNAIEQTCLRIQNLIVKNAQKCCYHLHSDLNLLRGMALWEERFFSVGLKGEFIVKAMHSVGSFMLKLTELQQVIDHSLKSTRSFFRWLISIACRMAGEQNNSVVPNDINKTTQQDIQLITDFILENFDYNQDYPNDEITDLSPECQGDGILSNRPTCSNFTLEQVGQYLKNEPLSRLKYSFMKPESNFWIEFFRKRPDLTEIQTLEEDGSSVLLFYKHNPNTSLIQEYKETCKSIKGAFDSMGSIMFLVLNTCTRLITFKDFIKNGATNRIRVETDIKTMQHYTLLQTKPDAAQKQYLIAQSLEDKSFKLVSIEFYPKRANLPRNASKTSSHHTSGPLLISDSSFYENKDTRTLLLSFLLLDQHCNDTIIVQIELNKIFEGINCTTRAYKDACKIFKSNETIDKQSNPIILELDLYTEPAHERRHGKEMMVKKIKSTCGKDMFSSSGRGVIAFTSRKNKRLHLYELESSADGPEIMDDEVEGDEKIDESLIDTDLVT